MLFGVRLLQRLMLKLRVLMEEVWQQTRAEQVLVVQVQVPILHLNLQVLVILLGWQERWQNATMTSWPEEALLLTHVEELGWDLPAL